MNTKKKTEKIKTSALIKKAKKKGGEKSKVEWMIIEWIAIPKNRNKIVEKFIEMEKQNLHTFNEYGYYHSQLFGISQEEDKKVQYEMVERAVKNFAIMFQLAKGITDFDL